MAPLYPQPGCIVEFLEDNAPRIAMVLEDSGGKLRLLLPGRRETKLSSNRILPWLGPVLPANISKDEAEKKLEEHQSARRQKKAQISALDAWEMANGEIAQAPANWFAELFETDPDSDVIAACGHALLDCKTHFKFQTPDFLVHDAEYVEKRLAENKAREEKEAIISHGSNFLRQLWDIACHKKTLQNASDNLLLEDGLTEKIKGMLLERVANPETVQDESLWQMISKGLPEIQHLPLQLLIAWGQLPKHYNFWLDRADYERGDEWWRDSEALVSELAEKGRNSELPENLLPFISVDGPKTIDIDDAFHIRRSQDGYELTIALAAPGVYWPFGNPLDSVVAHRATSIYLPEGDLHLLPRALGTDAFSLRAGERRPAFCLTLKLDANGKCLDILPTLATVRLAANLRYADVQKVIEGAAEAGEAGNHAEQIKMAHELACRREALRVSNGAIIMLREEPELVLTQTGDDVIVNLVHELPSRDSQRLVSEMMILAGSAIADWASQKEIPLLFRTQNVTLPPEYAGIWEDPAQLAKIIRALVPSVFTTVPANHAALGLKRYAQVTSPLRRYPDLINEAQIASYLAKGQPAWEARELEEMLLNLLPALEAASHVQKFRPRYWKLLYFRQAGDRVWHEGVITDENDLFVNVALPAENLFVRGKRNLFDERATPGARIRLRLGKINPLLNEIQILETISDD